MAKSKRRHDEIKMIMISKMIARGEHRRGLHLRRIGICQAVEILMGVRRSNDAIEG